MLIINDGVSKGRSLASSVVASVPSVIVHCVTSVVWRTLRALRWIDWTHRFGHDALRSCEVSALAAPLPALAYAVLL